MLETLLPIHCLRKIGYGSLIPCRLLLHAVSNIFLYIDTDTPDVKISADESVRFSKAWLAKCDEHRPPLESKVLPKRVIHIERESNNWKLTLRENVGKLAPYAALSYSWGGNQEFVTTKKSIQERKDGIEFSSLPKTIQDAVWVSFELGIFYLWVDSLCILQDDNKDRKTAFLYQDTVYSGANLTISASRASNHREGFLNDIVFKLNKRSEGDPSLIPVFLWKLNPPDGREPLSERAWAFQEYHLSNRILFYESYALRWACSCDTQCQSDEADKVDWFRNLSRENATDGDGGKPGKINAMRWQNAQECIEEWYNLLQRFSHRKITQLVDKLPAIMGVLLVHYTFLEKPAIQSGIWLPDNSDGNSTYDRNPTHPLPVGVIAGLLWFTKSNNSRKMRNPSWSWTSTDGHLDMSYCSDFLTSHPDVVVTRMNVQKSRLPKGPVYRAYSSVLMSFILDGLPITLRGPTLDSTLKLRHLSGGGDHDDKNSIQLEFDNGTTIDSGRALLDIDLWSSFPSQNADIGTSWQLNEKFASKPLTHKDIPKRPNIPVTLLRLFTRHTPPSPCMAGLILLRVQNENEKYIRIGVFCFKHDVDNESNWNDVNQAFNSNSENVTLI